MLSSWRKKRKGGWREPYLTFRLYPGGSPAGYMLSPPGIWPWSIGMGWISRRNENRVVGRRRMHVGGAELPKSCDKLSPPVVSCLSGRVFRCRLQGWYAWDGGGCVKHWAMRVSMDGGGGWGKSRCRFSERWAERRAVETARERGRWFRDGGGLGINLPSSKGSGI